MMFPVMNNILTKRNLRAKDLAVIKADQAEAEAIHAR
jgi:hypothetical protein